MTLRRLTGWSFLRKAERVTETTTSYTYRSPTGHLSATQFTQPALTLTEKVFLWGHEISWLNSARFCFRRTFVGWILCSCSFGRGHANWVLVSIVFYRGLTMQVTSERNTEGRSNYSMIAVNPSRISRTFNEQALQYVVEQHRGRNLMAAGSCQL